MRYRWKIENHYDDKGRGTSVGKSDFTSHRLAVADLIEEIKKSQNQLKYDVFEKDRIKTIIIVEGYELVD